MAFSAFAAPQRPTAAQAADEQTFKEFEGIVAEFAPEEKIQAWEAFIQKYPHSSYLPKAKEIIADLKSGGTGQLKAATPVPARTPKPAVTDPDLDFLVEKTPEPTPTPRPVATRSIWIQTTPTPTPAPVVARPRPTPTPASIFDAPEKPVRNDRLAFSDNGSPEHASSENTNSAAARFDAPPPPRNRSMNSFNRGIFPSNHFEVAPLFGISPDETYVRTYLAGVTLTEHLGRTWGLSLEALGADDTETALLQSLRVLDAEPAVISKYNFMVGGMLEANLLSAQAPVSNAMDGRNDLYIHAGGGDLNTNLEICETTNGERCASPLFIKNVNFTYMAAGIGYRFYFTPHILFRGEVRERVVLQLIDGAFTPITNIQINVGPSFFF